MGKSEAKTNAIRMLQQKKISFSVHSYDASGGAVDGKTVASMTGFSPSRVFKTLVTEGASRMNYVFVVPVTGELDLKKAARAVGEKSIAMLPQSRLLPLTGYVHGGCSPVGMKKLFPTVLDSSASQVETLLVSAGRIGLQMELTPADLLAVTGGTMAEVAL